MSKSLEQYLEDRKRLMSIIRLLSVTDMPPFSSEAAKYIVDKENNMFWRKGGYTFRYSMQQCLSEINDELIWMGSEES